MWPQGLDTNEGFGGDMRAVGESSVCSLLPQGLRELVKKKKSFVTYIQLSAEILKIGLKFLIKVGVCAHW